MEEIPIVDLSLLQQNSDRKSLLIKKIHEACRNHGFFHITNHGIPSSVIQETLRVNEEFFEMPMKMKEEHISDDIHKVVRLRQVQVWEDWREFLKLYAHPLDMFVDSWPRLPSDYREKMGLYSTEVRKLTNVVFGAILEGLNLEETHLKENFEQGFQMLGVHRYPPCLDEGSKLESGLPKHTDHSVLTVLLQSAPGLQIVDKVNGVNNTWRDVPELKGSLQVLVGDHLEVLSNGLYKSVIHRAIPNSCDVRLSIANLQSFGMDEIVLPFVKLENEDNPTTIYKGSSLRDYLNYLSRGDHRTFMETLKN